MINQMLQQKKLIIRPNYVLVRPTEKVSRKSATSGKNESTALLHTKYISVIVTYSTKILKKYFTQKRKFGH